jgi:DNA-binding beta-propeller fold protein YncE
MPGIVRITLLVTACIFATASLAATLDDGSRYAFAASTSEKRVYAIDMQQHQLAAQIEFDVPPDQVFASDGLDALIVSHRATNSLTLIDLSDDRLTRIDYPLDLSPDTILVSPLGDAVAVYDRTRERLEVHAVKRRALLLRAHAVKAGREFTFSPDGAVLYWLDSAAGKLRSIDLWSEQKAIQLVDPGRELSPLSRSADGLLGFVSARDTDEIFVINLPDFTLLATLRVPPGPGRPWGTADGRYMFVAGRSAGTVSAIATDSLQLVYSLRLEGRPVSIHSGWLDTVAAVTTESGDIVFFDVETGKILKLHPLGTSSLEAVVTSDSKTLALPLPAAGEIAFFDMRKQVLENRLDGLPRDIGEASMAVSNNLCH